jgi:UDP-N-acetylmuramoyl-tripeptide--D-alanyl-D-alanine ligase
VIPGCAYPHVAVHSRLVRPGSLFVALRGRRRDGHEFIADACARGAAAVLCEPGRGPRGVELIEADDTLAALGLLARAVRDASGASVVGVAGAAGKTSTKDILRALCAPHRRTVASPASFNNEVGVPLTLFQLEPDTELAICELGTGGRGEIRGLCAIARPRIGVVTCVGPEHLEFLGTPAGAAAAEAELVEALPPDGTAIVPYGEPLLAPYRADVTFGLDARADVHPIGASGLSVHGERIALSTPLVGAHQLANLCAAVAAYAALELPLDTVAAGAHAIVLSPWRGQERRTRSGVVVVNDAYNANPVSMRAAIETLRARADGGRTVAVLGEMAELGARAAAWHDAIGGALARAGVDTVVAIGPLARGYLSDGLDGHWFATRGEAAAALPALVRPGDIVLLKGSRAAALERLEAAIP